MTERRLRTAAMTVLTLLIPSACGDGEVDAGSLTLPASFVGASRCSACHAEQVGRWAGSHHDLAMQEVTAETVLGDFDDASFTAGGDTTTFSRHGDAFVIRTEGPGGALTDYEVKYVFGVEPLQQYILELDRGRLQPFTVAWDTRPAEGGGQRWFHLYADESIETGDPLHWTSPNMNWNYQCAECHTTGLHRGFELATLSYSTTWSEVDVSCEACHGPGSRHLEIIEDGPTADAPLGLGLNPRLADKTGGGWVIDEGETIARRTIALADPGQVETCAHCHSRRATLESIRNPASGLHDSDVVSRLENGLYHADGQISEEVYVYGSFVQSKMYAAGVRCSDCHEPHSLELRASGNALCARCHLPSAFDTPAHTFHEVGSTGAECVECHMPATTYMVVDPRRDHAMRVPRPGLTAEIGAPNACTRCHADESDTWATTTVEGWYGPRDDTAEYAARALHAARSGRPGAGAALAEVGSDASQPGIVRASAIAMSTRQPTALTLEAVRSGSMDPDPMVRLGALAALDGITPGARIPIAFRMLRDSVRSVRIEAARVLAPVAPTSFTLAQQGLLGERLQEYIDAQMVNADHPAAHTNVGNVYATRGVADAAEIAYRDAIRVDPTFGAAYLNLADLYRA